MRLTGEPFDAPAPYGGATGVLGFTPPFETLEPAALTSALVFSSPHSGSQYPRQFLDLTRLDALTLRRSEDAHVDDLFASALDIGAPLLRACFPRAYLDLNREPYELDPRMFEGRLPPHANTRSIRVAGGLGTIARVVGEAQEIYAARMPVAEALERIELLYKPYHAMLGGLMHRAAGLYGRAVLVDCHSMPSQAARGARPEDHPRADMVLGDRYGASCDPYLVSVVESELRRMGYVVLRNKPYAGGYITEHYGSPSSGWHAIQIEINRGLYMNEKTLERSAGYQKLKDDLATLARSLASAVEMLATHRAAAE